MWFIPVPHPQPSILSPQIKNACQKVPNPIPPYPQAAQRLNHLPSPSSLSPLTTPSSLSSAPTATALSSAFRSASLVPTVCSFPNSQVSFRTRVRERMSSAARIWKWGFSRKVRFRSFEEGGCVGKQGNVSCGKRGEFADAMKEFVGLAFVKEVQGNCVLGYRKGLIGASFSPQSCAQRRCACMRDNLESFLRNSGEKVKRKTYVPTPPSQLPSDTLLQPWHSGLVCRPANPPIGES